MNLIGALDQVDSGKIIVNGTDITTLNSKELANYRLVSTGFIFQAFHLGVAISLGIIALFNMFWSNESYVEIGVINYKRFLIQSYEQQPMAA